MLKRVLTCLAAIVLLFEGVYAQVDLSGDIALIREEKLDEAEQKLKGYLGQKPKNADEIYYYLGLIKYQQENYDEARKLFDLGIGVKSRSQLCMAGKGRMFIKDGKLADAYPLLQAADLANAKEKNSEVYIAIAEAYLEGGPAEIGEAKKILYGMRDSDPENPIPYIYLGTYYKKQGVPELALEELEKAIQKAPTYVPAYVFLAELKYDEGMLSKQPEPFNAGFRYAQKALDLNANYAPAYRIRGELYLLLKEFVKAKEDYRKYVSLTQNDLKARIRYASFLFLSEEYAEALNELQAIEKDTVTNVMYRLKGMSLNKLGRTQEARAALDTYFTKQPETYTIALDYEVYGDILRNQGDFDKADEYYQKAILKNTDRASIFEEIAVKYNAAAKEAEAAAKAADKSRIAALKQAQAHVDAYNQYVRDKNNDAALAELPKRDEQIALADQFKAEKEKQEGIAAGIYANESHYRRKALDVAEPVSMKHYTDLAFSQYRSKQYEAANKTYIEASALKADYAVPYQYRFQCAYYMEQADTTSNSWFAKPVAEDVLKVWGSADPSTLDAKVVRPLVLTALEVMANYALDADGDGQNFDCAASLQWIAKIDAIDPAYARIKNIKDYCSEQNR
ncbi:MAG: hypothetical protein SF053_04175 [Bacteroidia bacterium]|nr:hypothetical protein [Bacteroidia bacterium]